MQRFYQKVTSGGSATQINIGPPEVLLDVPYAMGCFSMMESFTSVGPDYHELVNLDPAKCITFCLDTDDRKRFVGNLQQYILDVTFRKKIIFV